MKKLILVTGFLILNLSVQAGIRVVSRTANGCNTAGGTVGTNLYAGVMAEVGDVIVMTTAGNKKGSVVAVHATQLGGTGSLVAQTALHNALTTYPTSFAFFQTVTGAGTFDLEFTLSNDAGMTGVSAYDRGAPILWHSPKARPYSAVDFNSTALRDGDYKLIWRFDTPGQDGEFHYELYNVKTDPGETQDLSQAMPAKAADLLGQIKVWHNDTNKVHGVRTVGVVQRPDSDDVAKPPFDYNSTVPVSMEVGGGSVTLSWADWVEYDYDLFSKTNLMDSSWTPVLSGSTATNDVDAEGDQAFYKVNVLVQPES